MAANIRKKLCHLSKKSLFVRRPEWNPGDSVQYAFIRNMRLSQARASAVLEYCLQKAGSPGLSEWAQQRLLATGYSSSRVVRDEFGEELANLSRRVVFSAGADQDSLLNSIEQEIAE